MTLAQNLDVSGGGVEVSTRPQLFVVEDSTAMSGFNPGVTYRLAITYTISGPWQADAATVTARLVELVEEDRQTLDPNAWVGRDRVKARGSLPVERKP